ncbi:MAG: GNAT family N-acetyltransferase [Dehalococcoidia bacterium]|nr:GNAT family N-acetyltransferase [Dehalococcoidia bacterium]
MTSTPHIEVRTYGPEDWQAYRSIRLAALDDAPHAFSSTLAREQAFAEADWRRRLEGGNLTLVAHVEGAPVGLAGGLHPGVYGGSTEAARAAAHLVQMWVHPSMRGRGVGDALVRGVVDWARDLNFPALRLWVIADNAPARGLYARLGFTDTGARSTLRDDDPRLEVEMALDLR